MTYQSINLPLHEINDSNWKTEADDSVPRSLGMSKGYVERETPYGQGFAAPFDDSWLIPESEWKDRIADREANGQTNKQLREYHNIPSLDQNGTNYCWAHGPTCCMQLVQVQSGETLRPLSAASIAAPIKNFQNVGGWGEQAISYMAKNGINEVVDWPINKIDRRYYTEQNKEKALLNRVVDWIDLKPKNFNQLVSCLLRGIPCSVAYMWWSHLVTAIDVVLVDGEICVLIWNSWSDKWGDRGMSVLRGSKKLPDEAIAPMVRLIRDPKENSPS